MYNYLFLNDEFAIMVCLLIVFSFLLVSLKKYVINLFFHIFDNVYFYFFILLNTNMHIYEYLLKKYIYIACAINFNQINLLLIFSNLILKKKIKENLVLKYIKKIRILFTFSSLTFSVLKYLNNILLNVNIVKNFTVLKNSYRYINFYSYKNRLKNNINFIC
jgi:hypothetical protein